MKIMTDSPIRFPGLFGDWAITISSKAIDIGNGIYWYGILIALGMLVALWWCMRQRTKYGIREDDLIDGLLWGIPSAIVGARLYYVLFYLSEFKDHEGHFSWSKAIAIWDGGLAIYGGVIAVVIVAIILCRSRHIKLGAMMDLVVMGLLIGQAIGRWGNFLNREAFGAETTLPWRMQLTTTAGELVEVHPTFLYESLWNLVGLLLIIFVVSKARRFDGENTCFYFLWYGVGRFWIEGLRTDSLYLFDWTIAGQLRVMLLLFPKYSYYSGDEAFSSSGNLAVLSKLAVYALVLLFGVLFGGKQTPEKGDVINFRSVCLLMVVCIVALRANVVSRLFRNIEPILCLYLPNLLAEKEEKEKRAGWILCVICFIAYATVIQLLRTPAWQRTYPYLFFWS